MLNYILKTENDIKKIRQLSTDVNNNCDLLNIMINDILDYNSV